MKLLFDPGERAKTATRSKFGKYTTEGEAPIRSQQIKVEGVLAEIMDKWSRFEIDLLDSTEARYQKALEASLPGALSSDIEKFSICLTEFAGGNKVSYSSAFFLAALINRGADSEYTLHVDNLNIHSLGYGNRKNIILNGSVSTSFCYRMVTGNVRVNGNAGDGVGKEMSGGMITIYGDAGDAIGEEMRRSVIMVNGNGGTHIGRSMENGTITIAGNVGQSVGVWMRSGAITVDGDAGPFAGDGMSGGILHIHGNAGKKAGHSMFGGELHIDGEIESLGEIKGGRVYHRGKLIVER